jgi:hypothetical protein
VPSSSPKTPVREPWWRLRHWRYYTGRLRCLLGIHRLKAWAAPDGGPNAYPMHPRSRPGPGDHRRCEFCGARWEGAYDGIEPSWRRVA